MLTTGHCVAMNYEAERKTEKLLKTDHKTTGDVHSRSVLYCQQEENPVEPKGSEWWLAGLHDWRVKVLSSDFNENVWRFCCLVFSLLFFYFFFGGWSMMDMESSEEGGMSWEH